jgi:hypothetical protein
MSDSDPTPFARSFTTRENQHTKKRAHTKTNTRLIFQITQVKTSFDCESPAKTTTKNVSNKYILWNVDALLCGDYVIGDWSAAVARQQPANKSREMVFFSQFAKQQLNNNRGTVFPLRSVQRSYMQDNWSNN